MTLLINILLGFYLFVAILMILVILMQRPKSEGLGAAFGGGVTENIFGAQTTNVLTKFTSWLAAIFFLMSFGLSVLYAHKASTTSSLQRELMKDLPTATPAEPSPSPGPAGAGANEASPSPSPEAGNSPEAGSPSPEASPTSTPAGSPAPSPTAATDLAPSPTPAPDSSTPSPDSSINASSPAAATATPSAHRRKRR